MDWVKWSVARCGVCKQLIDTLESTTCSTCVEPRCHTCCQKVYTVMFNGSNQNSVTCHNCWDKMKQCPNCAGWHNGKKKMCYHCLFKFCSVCKNHILNKQMCMPCSESIIAILSTGKIPTPVAKNVVDFLI